MINKIIGKLRKIFKEPIINFMYEFLMRSLKYTWGRKPFDTAELKLLTEALLSQNLFGIGGKMVPAFEMEFAKAYGVPYAVASTSGTAAIHTALGALDLNPGDEVITAPITDMGTVIPILCQNAIPVFADIDDSYNMDPADVERKITDRTRAIVVVHLFGNPCDMDKMVAIAKKRNIPLIEDCAQAHMTKYKGRFVGTIGDVGCFSFQQSKHMTTGDGGMTITSNKAYYDKMKLFVDKGFARKGFGSRAYLFHAPNYRMNELTAAVGRAQLKKVKGVVQKRNAMGKQLTGLLKNVPGVVIPRITEGAASSYWLFPMVIKSGDLEKFSEELGKGWFAASPGYTGKPIYLCSDSLTAKKTYGTSQFPFNSSFASGSYEYKEGLCPKAEKALERLVVLWWDESWDEKNVEKAAEYIKKAVKTITAEGGIIDVPDSPAEKKDIPAQASTEEPEKKIRIGIIGCGQMGKWHLDSYKKNPGVELAAFVDTDIERAKKLVRLAKSGKAYISHTEMLKAEKLDGVSVCTVPSTHRDIVIDLLNSGIHVLCEKPLAVSVGEASEMVQKAEECRKALLTAFKFRFFEEVRKAKELLEKNSIGRVMNFRLMFGGYLNMTGTWFVDPKISGGGVIMDNAPHAFDLIRYLLGEIEDVSAEGTNYQDVGVEDTAQIVCKLKNGGRGVVDVSWSSPVPAKNYMEIYGEEGTILLDFSGISYRFKTWDEFRTEQNQATIPEAFVDQVNHFVSVIEGADPTITAMEDGIKAQQLIEEVYSSVKIGGCVT